MAQRKYLDLTGLTEFKTKLLNAYSKNDQASFSTNFAVAKAGKADILATARTIGLSGDVSGTATSFNGSENITITTTIADVVASTSGAGGSHGLMTAAQAEKLAGVATGAQVNVLEGVQIKNNGDSDFSDLTISSKKVQIDLSGYAKLTDIAAALNFKGTATGAALKGKTTSNTANGDVYSCTEDDLTGNFKFHEGFEYAAVVSGTPATLTWVELGKYLDLSGYALKTQKVNGHAFNGDITLDGSDIALTGYTKASSSAAVAATDTVNAAVGKLEKKVDDAVSAAATYAFAEGTTNGAFQVTPTVGGVAGSAQSVKVHGLGSAAYTASSDYVSSSLTPAEAGAQVNVIEEVQVNGVALTPTNKSVNVVIPAATVTDVQTKTSASGSYTSILDGTVAKIDLSGYAVDADIISIPNSEIDALFPAST